MPVVLWLLAVMTAGLVIRRIVRHRRWVAEGRTIGAITDDLRARRVLLDWRIEHSESLSEAQRERLDRNIVAWVHEGEAHLGRATRWREARP